MSLSQWQPRNSNTRTTYPWRLAMVVVASTALHGLLLLLPWPFEKSEKMEPPQVKLEEVEGDAAVDVTILPEGTLLPAVEEGPTTEEEPSTEEEPPDFAEQPPPLKPEPEPEPEPDPESELEPTPETELESEPESELEPKPDPELPTEPGTNTSEGPAPSVPPPPDALSVAMSGATHNGRKSLNDDDEKERASIDWFLANYALSSEAPREADPVEVEYPLDECKEPAPTDGLFVVVANPDGEVIFGRDNPDNILGSTGYEPLDEKAWEVINSLEFEAKDEARSYVIEVKIAGYPDHCP
ncbi:MAG: hypothetical protein AAFN08_04365, partial [Cyanobacteria bacterium J06559_3]